MMHSFILDDNDNPVLCKWRYTSAEQARANHARIVSELVAPGLMVRYRELKGMRRPKQFIRWRKPREEGEEYVFIRPDWLKISKNVTKYIDRMSRIKAMKEKNRRIREA